MSERKKYTAEELTQILTDMPRPDKITSGWVENDPSSRIIAVTYPDEVKDWDEYYAMVDEVSAISQAARDAGELGKDEKIAILHMPLETQMPEGSPVPPLKKALLDGEKAGAILVVMVINNPFANFVTNRVFMPALSFNTVSKKRGVANIAAAARELVDF